MSGAAESPNAARRSAALRFVARHRRRFASATLALPVVLIILADVAMRGERLAGFPLKYFGSYAAAMVESATLWALLLCAASARRGFPRWFGGLAFVLLATLSIGGQIYFHRQYSTYLNLDATLFGTSLADSLFGQLSADSRNFATSVAPVAITATVLVCAGRRLIRTRRKAALIATAVSPVALVAVLLIPCSYRAVQGSTPDVIYFHAVGGLIKQLTGIAEQKQIRPRRRNPPPLPAITATPPAPRNVLFVLTESTRADAGCSSHRASCPTMPFSNALLPQRLGLEQMRSNSSTTATQLAVLWTGLAPNAGRKALHDTPTLFDFAHAAGYATAYWTSHHMLFANSRLFVQDLPLDAHCHATSLDALANIDLGADDALLSEHVRRQIGELKEPFFAMVQFGNTHVPYLVDDDDTPFQPSLASKAPEDNDAYHNYYLNAVYRQDRAVAALLQHVREAEFGPRTVVVYTSDHGEQFREHNQLGHTASVFDVELHVPTWIDAPAGTITTREREALASYRDASVFHTDLTPTMLDLMGLLEAPAVAPYRVNMVGSSLLRGEYPERTVALTNCTGVWGCVFQNWGLMRGSRKLHAREWDGAWLCYDVARDPGELNPLPLDRCANLVTEAERIYPSVPGQP